MDRLRDTIHRICAALPFILALGGLGACLPAATPLPPLPTNTPPPATFTPTSTVVWFPPTPTFTPFPLQTAFVTPTAEVLPVHGDLILADDFSDPKPWKLERGSAGSAAVSKGQLTLAVSQERSYLYSIRYKPTLTDFYAEVTASPTLCRDADEYGLLVRFASTSDFYRFSVSCDGQARLDRVLHGQASSPQPWVLSGAIPPGAPSSSRLAVLVSGKEMRFIVNDQQVFSASDPTIPSGSLGFFARSASDTPVTVNFSDLAIYKPAP